MLERTSGERRPRILLVDDESNFRWSVARALEMKGYEVATGSSGEEALELLNQASFDLVLTDIKMPGIDGFELVEWLRTHRPEVAVVMVTAFGSLSMRERSLSAGSISYVEKPIDLNALTDFLHRFFHAPGFAGRVSEIDLLDYLQLIVNTHKSKVVQVQNRHRVGRLIFEHGNLVHAELGEQAGLAAFYDILSWEGGGFTDIPFEVPNSRTVAENTAFLLMEAARVRDERSIDPEQLEAASLQSRLAEAEEGLLPGASLPGTDISPSVANGGSSRNPPLPETLPQRGAARAADPKIGGPFARFKRFIEDLAKLPAVRGAVLVSREGLMLARAGVLPAEWESLVLPLVQAADDAGEALELGEMQRVTLNLEQGERFLLIKTGAYRVGVRVEPDGRPQELASWVAGRSIILE